MRMKNGRIKDSPCEKEYYKIGEKDSQCKKEYYKIGEKNLQTVIEKEIIYVKILSEKGRKNFPWYPTNIRSSL